jgi:CYTH domain-containing protein
MGIEIERKFLVAGESWRASAGAGIAMRQGYLAAGGADQPSVRIRIAGDAAFLTIKGPGGLSRAEFEYPVPVADGEAMLALCRFAILAKTRFPVRHAGHLWTVDVFGAPTALAGLVLAEVELPDIATDPPLPPWLGAEVTGDPRFSNSALAAALAGG